MSIVKKNQALETMPGLLNNFITNDLWDWGLSNNSYTDTTIPSVNIRETNDNFEVEMAAPGMVHFIYQKMSLMLKTFQPDMKMVCCM